MTNSPENPETWTIEDHFEGVTLEEIVAQIREAGGPLDWAKSLVEEAPYQHEALHADAWYVLAEDRVALRDYALETVREYLSRANPRAADLEPGEGVMVEGRFGRINQLYTSGAAQVSFGLDGCELVWLEDVEPADFTPLYAELAEQPSLDAAVDLLHRKAREEGGIWSHVCTCYGLSPTPRAHLREWIEKAKVRA